MKIKSFAKYVPERIITNDELSTFIDTSDEWITSRTGIKTRHITDGENTSDFCTKVGLQLLDDCGMNPEEIGLIIVATCSPDYQFPSVACLVQKGIGAKNAFAFDITAACSGFMYALSIAEKYIKTGACKNVMIIGGETLSKIVDWTERSTCVLFGDGAGGIILSGEDGADSNVLLAESLYSDGDNFEAVMGQYNRLNNPFLSEKDEKIQEYVSMNGRRVYDFVLTHVPACINETLQKASCPIEEVKYFVLHQANARIIEAIAKKMKLDISRFFVNINKYGNTSAASIPIALSEMYEQGLIGLTGRDKVILSGFGSGMTWGSVLINV